MTLDMSPLASTPGAGVGDQRALSPSPAPERLGTRVHRLLSPQVAKCYGRFRG
jgi:hypothetical protein